MTDSVNEPERSRLCLEELPEHLTDPELLADHLKLALPKAVKLASKENNALSGSLKPLVEQIMEKSVRQNPNLMIEVLFPIIGSAVRKSVKDAMEKMMESVNQTMELSLTWQSFKWRLEAMRTGKPFSEIVLYHTLIYRVEQAFLVHRETGTLLAHVATDAVNQGQGDLVSSMLTAIQDFVKDSFQLEEGTPVESMRVGELEVWVESRAKVYLALAIRGNVPLSVRALMQRAVDDVQQQYAEELEAFDGETDPFQGCVGMLRLCLKSRRRPPASAKGGLALVMLIVLALGLSWGRHVLEQTWGTRALRAALADQAGVVVTKYESISGGYAVYGLRDPSTLSLLELARYGGYSGKVEDRTQAYISLDPQLIIRRARRAFKAPLSVQMEVVGDVLHLSGQAPAEWTQSLARKNLPIGIRAVDTTHLGLPGQVVEAEREPEPPKPKPVVVEKPLPSSLTEMMDELSLVNLHFGSADRTLTDEERAGVARVVQLINACDALAKAHGQSLSVQIQALVAEDDMRLKLIAFNRAKSVKDALEQQGLPRGYITLKKSIATGAEVTPGSEELITIIFPAELRAIDQRR